MNSYERKQEARRQRYEELAEKNRKEAAQRFGTAREIGSHIPFGAFSIVSSTWGVRSTFPSPPSTGNQKPSTRSERFIPPNRPGFDAWASKIPWPTVSRRRRRSSSLNSSYFGNSTFGFCMVRLPFPGVPTLRADHNRTQHLHPLPVRGQQVQRPFCHHTQTIIAGAALPNLFGRRTGIAIRRSGFRGLIHVGLVCAIREKSRDVQIPYCSTDVPGPLL